MRRLLAALAVVGLTLLAGCSSGSSDDGGFQFVAPNGQTQITYPEAQRRPLAPIVGDSLLAPGQQVSSAQDKGQVVVVNIWGSWCGPCRGESPGLEQVAQASAARGVRFLGVDVRDDRDAASDFVRSRGVTYPSIFDPPGRSLLVLSGYPRNAVPSTIVLDRQHRVAAVFLTAVLASDLQPVVDRVAAEPAPPPSG
ncbi:TlpA disulfide reductase family protein [Actinomycetospora sp. TBRC 11914]|uniref:TlpA family protein disulfide reductase n=1 Tax=Actinomycetospora sp. TBRC 11914 TaxID=2729387 RepID=UPI00145E98C8|nr:TlpA disulfide reductase family protein [Actinomycetospora sp. TBRC 11914]NMO91865.1 TlpA family protein disulfide reductase [Actinomycetospora sp. TBRC 11914]